MLFWRLLLLVGAAGLVTSTGYLVLVMIASARFRRERHRAHDPICPSFRLSPCSSRSAAWSLASKNTSPASSNSTIPATRSSSARVAMTTQHLRWCGGSVLIYPSVPVKIVISGEPWRPNAKVCSLVKMYERASHDYLIISDSDVKVSPNYIAEVVQPMLDPQQWHGDVPVSRTADWRIVVKAGSAGHERGDDRRSNRRQPAGRHEICAGADHGDSARCFGRDRRVRAAGRLLQRRLRARARRRRQRAAES